MSTPLTPTPTDPAASALTLLQPINEQAGLAAPSMLGGLQFNLSANDLVAVKTADVELDLKKQLRIAQDAHTSIVSSIEEHVAAWDKLVISTVAPTTPLAALKNIVALINESDSTLVGRYDTSVSWSFRISFDKSDMDFHVPSPAEMVVASITAHYTLDGSSRETQNSVRVKTSAPIPLPSDVAPMIDKARSLAKELNAASATIRDLRTRLSNIPAVERQARAALTRGIMSGSTAGAALLAKMDSKSVDEASSL